jgi:uncharacterized protein (DUF2384 family)
MVTIFNYFAKKVNLLLWLTYILIGGKMRVNSTKCDPVGMMMEMPIAQLERVVNALIEQERAYREKRIITRLRRRQAAARARKEKQRKTLCHAKNGR